MLLELLVLCIIMLLFENIVTVLIFIFLPLMEIKGFLKRDKYAIVVKKL